MFYFQEGKKYMSQQFYGCHTLFLSSGFFITVHFFYPRTIWNKANKLPQVKEKGVPALTLQENCCTFIEQWSEIGSVSLSDITPAQVFFYLLRYVLMFSFPFPFS